MKSREANDRLSSAVEGLVHSAKVGQCVALVDDAVIRRGRRGAMPYPYRVTTPDANDPLVLYYIILYCTVYTGLTTTN